MSAPSTLHRSPQGEADNAGTAAVFPRRAALLIGGSVVASLAGVTIARLTGWQAVHADAPTVQERALHFRDQNDGGVAVLDADTGQTLQVLHGEQGFLRGTLRGMARERRRRGLGSATTSNPSDPPTRPSTPAGWTCRRHPWPRRPARDAHAPNTPTPLGRP